MNAYHLLFRTNRFNLSKAQKHFVNPSCFGDDLAAWLQEKLLEQGIQTSAPAREDWGRYLKASYGKNSYFLAMNGNSVSSASDDGEWRIIVEKKRSLWERMSGKGKIASDDRMLQTIEDILAQQPDFQDLRREADGPSLSVG
jgi:hypothetical protein